MKRFVLAMILVVAFTLSMTPATVKADDPPEGTPITVALASIADKLVIIWTWDNQNKNWIVYDPIAPPWASAFNRLKKGMVYYIQTSGPCEITLFSGGQKVGFREGSNYWNSVGWQE
jgi:hypothetical protein